MKLEAASTCAFPLLWNKQNQDTPADLRLATYEYPLIKSEQR